jgi:hypothetical protein
MASPWTIWRFGNPRRGVGKGLKVSDPCWSWAGSPTTRPADAEEIALWLGVPVTVAAALCAELEAAGLLTAARDH